ncbi:MAG: DUF6291 domain-containing protein [Christensenellales bacterium]
MGIIRDSFIILKNWAEAISALPEEYQLETYKALMQYGLNGEIPQNISPVANAMLISFSKGMENNILRYNASVENGKLGGRPKKNENLEKPNKTQQNLEKPSETQPNLDEPNHNLNVNDNVNDINNKVVVDKLSTNNSARAHEETTTPTTNVDLILLTGLCKDLEIDCEFDSSKYDLQLLREKIKESRYLKLFRSLKELLSKYDKIIADKYKDFKIDKLISNSQAKKREYTKEDLDALFDDIHSIEI